MTSAIIWVTSRPIPKLTGLLYFTCSLLLAMPVNAEMTGHVGYVNSLVVTNDGKTAISASWDTTIRLWNLSKHTEFNLLDGHIMSVNEVALSPIGNTFASASWDHSIRLWSYRDGTEIAQLVGHDDAVYGVDFSPDGQSLVSASWDYTLKLWD
ncbi:uncharacterized protein METZ01_LOCUS411038, partial [marine metagenome]